MNIFKRLFSRNKTSPSNDENLKSTGTVGPKVKQIINEITERENNLSNRSTLDDIGLDSLDAVEITCAVEAEFDIYISDFDLEQINCFGDFVKYLDSRIKSSSENPSVRYPEAIDHHLTDSDSNPDEINFIEPAGLGDQLSKTQFRDTEEQRSVDEFDILKKVMEIADENVDECISLCLVQIEKTPDYDMSYIWASNFQNARGEIQAALSTLANGLQDCKRVSGILNKLGMRYLDLQNPVLATVSFARSILAQNPSRSDHDPYLYFSYICRFCDYVNAAEKALLIARKIYGGPIDLTLETQHEIESLVQVNIENVKPLLRMFIQNMLEEDRMD